MNNPASLFVHAERLDQTVLYSVVEVVDGGVRDFLLALIYTGWTVAAVTAEGFRAFDGVPQEPWLGEFFYADAKVIGRATEFSPSVEESQLLPDEDPDAPIMAKKPDDRAECRHCATLVDMAARRIICRRCGIELDPVQVYINTLDYIWSVGRERQIYQKWLAEQNAKERARQAKLEKRWEAKREKYLKDLGAGSTAGTSRSTKEAP